MRGFLLLLLLAPALAAEDPWAKLDRDEFERLFGEIMEEKDPRWRTRAVELRRRYEDGKWQPGNSAPREVHGVSFTNGDPRARKDQRRDRTESVARVKVTRKGCGVVLVLSAANAIEWRIEAEEGVKIEKVLLTGSPHSVVRGGVDAERVQHIGRIFAYQRRTRQFSQLQAAVAPRVGGLPITTYSGKVRPEHKILIVGPGNEDWQRQMLLADMRALHRAARKSARAARMKTLRRYVFPAVVWQGSGRRVFCDCTVEGPVADTFSPVPRSAFTATLDPDTGRRYFLSTRGVEERDRRNNLLRTIDLPEWLGPRGWASVITFDTRRRRVILASMTGALASFQPRTATWEPLRKQDWAQGGPFVMRGADGWLSAMTYDPGRDCFWALHSTGARTTLTRMDPFGTRGDRRVLRIPVQLQPGGRNGTALAMVGDQLALLAVNWTGRQRKANRTYVIDPEKGSVFLDLPVENSPRLDPPPREDWPALWDSLRSHDPYGAIRLCARGRAPLIAYLRDRWESLPRLDEARVTRALEDLGASDAEVRSHAYAVLSGGSPDLVVRLEKEIEEQESPDVRLALLRLIAQYRSEPDLRARLQQVLEEVTAPGAATFRAKLRDGSD